MQSQERILESLLELTSHAGPRSIQDLIGIALRCALKITSSAGGTAMISLTRSTERFTLRQGLEAPEVVSLPRAAGDPARPVPLDGRPLVLDSLDASERVAPEDHCPGVDAGPALFVPLRSRQQAPGYLAVYRNHGSRSYTDEDSRLLTMLAAWIAVSLDNLRLAQNVERLAVTDDLTQVYNYRFLKGALRREIKRAGRYHQNLGLLMIDVDNLKSYNDQHGHLRGSNLLREMAGLFAAHVRSWDLVAKYGGDEFTVILPQTDLAGAMAAGERLRGAVAGHRFPLTHAGQITVSIGVSVFPADGQTTSALVGVADRALYSAKQHGRNRVMTIDRQAAA